MRNSELSLAKFIAEMLSATLVSENPAQVKPIRTLATTSDIF